MLLLTSVTKINIGFGDYLMRLLLKLESNFYFTEKAVPLNCIMSSLCKRGFVSESSFNITYLFDGVLNLDIVTVPYLLKNKAMPEATLNVFEISKSKYILKDVFYQKGQNFMIGHNREKGGMLGSTKTAISIDMNISDVINTALDSKHYLYWKADISYLCLLMISLSKETTIQNNFDCVENYGDFMDKLSVYKLFLSSISSNGTNHNSSSEVKELLATDHDEIENVHIAHPGIVLQTKCSKNHNFIYSLFGYMSVVAFPPTAFHEMYIYPNIHVNYLYSQIFLEHKSEKGNINRRKHSNHGEENTVKYNNTFSKTRSKTHRNNGKAEQYNSGGRTVSDNPADNDDDSSSDYCSQLYRKYPNFYNADPKDVNYLNGGKTCAIKIKLKPKDLLFIPSSWCYRMETVTLSAFLQSTVPSQITQNLNNIFDEPVPFGTFANHTNALKVAIHIYLKTLVSHVRMHNKRNNPASSFGGRETKLSEGDKNTDLFQGFVGYIYRTRFHYLAEEDSLPNLTQKVKDSLCPVVSNLTKEEQDLLEKHMVDIVGGAMSNADLINNIGLGRDGRSTWRGGGLEGQGKAEATNNADISNDRAIFADKVEIGGNDEGEEVQPDRGTVNSGDPRATLVVEYQIKRQFLGDYMEHLVRWLVGPAYTPFYIQNCFREGE